MGLWKMRRIFRIIMTIIIIYILFLIIKNRNIFITDIQNFIKNMIYGLKDAIRKLLPDKIRYGTNIRISFPLFFHLP